MITATIQKSYKKLEERVKKLEKIVTIALQDEISSARLKKLEKISESLDKGKGKHFSSSRSLFQYLDSL